MLTFGSLFCGVGGFDLGFERAGMECKWQVEINPQCRNVLGYHWTALDLHRGEDVRNVKTADFVRPDVICGGFPCQDLSVAGRRAGLAGERSGLFHEFMRIAAEFRPGWLVIENVPGLLSSNGGRDMGTVLGTLGQLGYRWAYRVLDAQFFGVAQRRRRVFIVASAGDRPHPAEVLFDTESLSRNPPSREEAGSRVAASLTAGTAAGRGVNAPGRRREDDVNIVAGPLTTRATPNGHGQAGVNNQDVWSNHIVPQAMTSKWAKGSSGPAGDEHHNLVPVAFAQNQRGELRTSSIMPQLTCGGGKPGEGYPAVAVPYIVKSANSCDRANHAIATEHARCLDATGGFATNQGGTVIAGSMAVRRLTPRECERLQGFPDDWTRFGADGTEISDSARYRMLGNAVAVPVAEWIGRRLMVIT